MTAVHCVEMKEAWLGDKMTPALHDFDMELCVVSLWNSNVTAEVSGTLHIRCFPEDTLRCRNAYPNDSDQNIVYSG